MARLDGKFSSTKVAMLLASNWRMKVFMGVCSLWPAEKENVDAVRKPCTAKHCFNRAIWSSVTGFI